MRSRWIFFVLFSACTAFAQSVNQQPGPPPSAPPSGGPLRSAQMPSPSPAPQLQEPVPSIPDSAVVLTLDGICDPTGTSTAPCKTEVTKAEFDRILSLTSPPGMPSLPGAMKRERANQIAQLITVAAAAKKSGVLQTPEGEEALKLATFQALANVYIRQIQSQSKPTESEVETYYKNNISKFQQATLKQLFVPPLKPADGKSPDPAAQLARAEKFRERIIAGEPFEKLEKEAIEGTQYPTPPPVDVTFQKDSIPPIRQFVFDLKEGELSKVITDPAGSVIYKLVSKGAIPFGQVKDSLAQRMQQEKFQAAVEAATKGATPVLNDAYFGSSAPKATPGGPMAPPTAPPNPPAPKQ